MFHMLAKGYRILVLHAYICLACPFQEPSTVRNYTLGQSNQFDDHLKRFLLFSSQCYVHSGYPPTKLVLRVRQANVS